MRIARPWLVACVAMLLPCLNAAQTVREDATISLANAIPVTLQSLGAGTTTLGASATSATTTGVTLPGVGSTNVLRVVHGATAYSVSVRLVSSSGFAVTDSAIVAINDGTTTRNQVVIAAGVVTQSQGTALTLAAAGPNITVLASGVVVGTGTYTLRIQMVPTSGTGYVLEYSYTLSVT
jgi:hypothetical protein